MSNMIQPFLNNTDYDLSSQFFFLAKAAETALPLRSPFDRNNKWIEIENVEPQRTDFCPSLFFQSILGATDVCILRWKFSLASDLGLLWLAVVCVCVCVCVCECHRERERERERESVLVCVCCCAVPRGMFYMDFLHGSSESSCCN